MALLPSLFWFAIAVSTLTAAFAVYNARGLAYDGSFYLLGVAGRRGFHLVEPARLSTQALQQVAAVFGLRLGLQNLWRLGTLFSLGMFGWPILLTVICWFVVPRREKSWIAGPLINLVFAIPAASFIGIGEGMIASCLLWLGLLLVMFRLAHPVGAIAALACVFACAVAHEATAPCLLLIAWCAAAQYPRLQGFSRWATLFVAVIAIAGVFYMARWIIFPRSSIERADYFVSMLGGFLGSPRIPNLPVIASLAAMASIAAVIVWSEKAVPAVFIGTTAIAVCGVAFATVPDAFASAGRFFASRGLPVALTTLLALSFVVLQRRGESPAQFITRPAMSIVLVLVISQALMQVAETNLWRGYTNDLRVLVATRKGAISHREALEALDANSSRFRREMLQTWSVEPLSILLAPNGRVRAMVEPAETEGWMPYHLANPKTLPHIPQLDWSDFPGLSRSRLSR